LFVVPWRWKAHFPDYESLLRSKTRWILRKLEHLERIPKQEFLFTDASRLPFLGKEIELRIQPANSKRTRVELVDNQLLIQISPIDETAIRDIVEFWCYQTAKRIIPTRVQALNSFLGYSVGSISIRDQRSRWGSCSRRGNLSFNWRLLLAPTSVMDYLTFHELAHLKEMNHSKKFWDLVEQLCPTYRDSECWLKREGKLMFW